MKVEIIQDVIPIDICIRYIHIVNRPTLNNVLARRNKRRQIFPVSDRTDSYKILAYAKHLLIMAKWSHIKQRLIKTILTDNNRL